MKTADLETQKQQLEAARERQDTEVTEYVNYRIAGDDVAVVKLLLMELYSRYGEQNAPFMYLPLEIVMKTLVGSDDDVGYIQSISEGEPCEISVEFYETRHNCLKDALLEVFPNLTIEIIDNDERTNR